MSAEAHAFFDQSELYRGCLRTTFRQTDSSECLPEILIDQSSSFAMSLVTTELRNGRQLVIHDRPMFESARDFTFHDCADPKMSVESAWIGRIDFHRVRSTGHALTLNEPELFTLLLPREGRIRSETKHARIDARPGTVVTCGPGSRRTSVRAGRGNQFEADCIVVPTDVLSVDLCPELRVGPALGNGGSMLSGTARFVIDLVNQPAGAPVTERMLKLGEAIIIEAIDMYLGAILQTDGERDPSRYCAQLVRRAERLLMEEYQEDISMTDVAKRLGVSTRSLQLAFRTIHDVTPREFLFAFRLDRAREALARSGRDVSVTAVAHDCGFAHLGRFAVAYRQRFGEKPSDTMQR